MLLSMTGFGRAEGTIGGRPATAEIKSLNGKGFDLNTRLPSLLRAHELDVRGVLSGILQRGTADVAVTLGGEGGSASRTMSINTALAATYYADLQRLAGSLGIPVGDDALAILLKMPEVLSTESEMLPEGAWEDFRTIITTAADALTQHRRTEGAALERDLRARIAAILAALESILPLEAPRNERIRERITAKLAEHVPADAIDGNRLEQEMIYYLERSDFSEEKTRLAQHCEYFLALLDEEGESGKGKRLNFVLQEVGREVNTLGSKASDADIQRIVVGMKDELEKMKEQVLNVL